MQHVAAAPLPPPPAAIPPRRFKVVKTERVEDPFGALDWEAGRPTPRGPPYQQTDDGSSSSASP